MKKSEILAISLFFLFFNASAAVVSLTCVESRKDNDSKKTELSIKFDDNDRSSISVNDIKYPSGDSEDSRILKTFGDSIINFSVQGKTMSYGWETILDRRTGTIVTIGSTGHIISRGECYKSSDIKNKF